MIKEFHIWESLARPKESKEIGSLFEDLKSDIEPIISLVWKDVQEVKHSFNKQLPELKSSVCTNMKISSHVSYMTMGFDIVPNNTFIAAVHNILQGWCDKLVDSNNIYMTHRCTYGKFTIYFKKLKTEKAQIERYLYHVSRPANRSSIKKLGLVPKGSDDSTAWSGYDYLAYPPAVFATNMGMHDTWHVSGDIWRIDTNELNNEWWYDLNFYGAGDRRKYVMTFDPIPKKYIKLVKNGDNREWTCSKCNSHHDRDTNAAINIKNFGLRNKPSVTQSEWLHSPPEIGEAGKRRRNS